MTDDLTPNLTRTVALLGDGYRLPQIARGKRAQERTEMLQIILTDDEQARALAREHYRHKARVAAIVDDAAALVETVGADAYTSIAVHNDDLLAAALDLPGAERNDYVASDTGRPAVSCRLGRVTFFGSVRL